MNLGAPPKQQLTRSNFPIWRVQVLPAIRGAMAMGLLDGSEAAPPKTLAKEKDAADATAAPNPAYAAWLARDQIVLSYLVNSISPEILQHILRLEHAAPVWSAVEKMFASQCVSKVTNLRVAIATTKKLSMTTTAFFAKMQSLADALAAAGRPIDDDELVSFILAGLGPDYSNLVGAIGLMTNPISVTELYAQVLAQDERDQMNAGSHGGEFETSANAAMRRGGYTRGGYNRGRGRGAVRTQDDHAKEERRDDRPYYNNRGGGRRGGGGGRGRGRGRRRTSPWENVTCQICNKEGHRATDCWSRYDEDGDDDEEKEVHAASYGVDTNWYPDTGATHHITSELNNLTVRDPYQGRDKVNTASGQGMDIRHVGHSIIHTHVQNFHLNNILHVPNASKNLLSVHKLTYDNRVFIEFHPSFFFIKDQVTKKIIHRGQCVGGLYPLISSLVSPHTSQKHAFVAAKPSQEMWHSCLGRPLLAIVQQAVSKNKLPSVRNSTIQSICDSCQKAKSHQLPYPVSTSVSSVPLQLIFSDVWGPAPISVG